MIKHATPLEFPHVAVQRVKQETLAARSRDDERRHTVYTVGDRFFGPGGERRVVRIKDQSEKCVRRTPVGQLAAPRESRKFPASTNFPSPEKRSATAFGNTNLNTPNTTEEYCSRG